MKQSLINLLPPATLAAILAFWAFAPDAWQWPFPLRPWLEKRARS